MPDPILTPAALLACAGTYALASTLLAAPGLHDRLIPGARFKLATDGVALTFDDGPHPERTPRLLDVLAARRVRATFFLVGREVRRFPSIARRLVQEGHVLGNHTDAHRWAPGLSTTRLAAELDDCQRTLEDVTGHSPAFVRPPYGHRDLRFLRTARDRGLVPVFWSLDSFDYARLPPALVLRRLRRARPGDVILLHDGNPTARGTLPAVADFLDSTALRPVVFA